MPIIRLNSCHVTFINNSKKDITSVICPPSYNLPQTPLIDRINTLFSHSIVFTLNTYDYPLLNIAQNAERFIEDVLNDIALLIFRGDILLAANLSDQLFNSCADFWIQEFIQNGRHIIAKEYWKKILEIVDNWISRNNPGIHLGTPYYFLSHTCFLMDDIENAYVFLGKAFEEDKILCEITSTSLQSKPSYLTISLSLSPNNFMYPMVQEITGTLNDYRVYYNRWLRKRVSFNTIHNNFFQSTTYENIRLLLLYLLHILKLQENILNRLDNDFSKVRIMNLIFCLALVVDKILYIRFGEDYLGGNVIALCQHKNWGTNNLIQNIWNAEPKRKFKSLNKSDFEDIVNKLLDFNLIYQGNRVRKEIQILMLTWGLRNKGAHELDKNSILVERYKEIIQFLINSFFISVY